MGSSVMSQDQSFGSSEDASTEPLLRPNKNRCGHSRFALFIFLYLNPLSLNHRAAEFVVLLALHLTTSGAAALALAHYHPQCHYAAALGFGIVALVLVWAMQRLYLTVAERFPESTDCTLYEPPDPRSCFDASLSGPVPGFLGIRVLSFRFTGPLSYLAYTQLNPFWLEPRRAECLVYLFASTVVVTWKSVSITRHLTKPPTWFEVNWPFLIWLGFLWFLDLYFLELPMRAWRPHEFPDPRRLFPTLYRGLPTALPTQASVLPTKTVSGHTRFAHYFFRNLNPFALNYRAAEFVVFFPFVLLTCVAVTTIFTILRPDKQYGDALIVMAPSAQLIWAFTKYYLWFTEWVMTRQVPTRVKLHNETTCYGQLSDATPGFLGRPRLSFAFRGPLSRIARGKLNLLAHDPPAAEFLVFLLPSTLVACAGLLYLALQAHDATPWYQVWWPLILWGVWVWLLDLYFLELPTKQWKPHDPPSSQSDSEPEGEV